MLNKFFNFLSGYVIINVYGKNYERFLNICLRRGLKINSVSPISDGLQISMSARDFVYLRPVARKCRVKVRIKEKHYLRHEARKYRKRFAFLIAAIICIAFCLVSSRYIWLVEINGADEDNIEEITAVLDEIGVKRGALKSALPDGMEIKRRIINGTGKVAWAWVYIEGAKARVEISEKIIPPMLFDKNEPCDIVAACDGIIKSMNVKNGEKKVKSGDAVAAGDMLVSGKVDAFREGHEENYIFVHSIADIYAYTVRSAAGEYKLYYESRIPTGKKKRRHVLEIFGKVISIPFGNIAYDDYDRSESRFEINIPFFGFSGIALNTVEIAEVEVNREPVPIEVVLDSAKNQLEEQVAHELTAGAVLSDEQLEYEQIDNETIKVTLNMNFTENIAVTSTMNTASDKGEEILDNQTDTGTGGN